MEGVLREALAKDPSRVHAFQYHRYSNTPREAGAAKGWAFVLMQF